MASPHAAMNELSLVHKRLRAHTPKFWKFNAIHQSVEFGQIFTLCRCTKKWERLRLSRNMMPSPCKTRKVWHKTAVTHNHIEISWHHDDVIKWKHFPHYWPFVRGIHRSPVNSPHKGQWRGALMFSLICVWINDWINNREAGDLRRYRAQYDVIVITTPARAKICGTYVNHLSMIGIIIMYTWERISLQWEFIYWQDTISIHVFGTRPGDSWLSWWQRHYGDVIMDAMASQFTSLTIVYSTVYSDTDQRKHQSSASLAFVWGIHRGPVNSPHKGPRTIFPFNDVIME